MSPYKILRVQREDVPTLVSISHEAFKTDRHTMMKMHEKGTDDMGSEMPGVESFHADLAKPDMVKVIKAVNEDGEIVGYTTWRLKLKNPDPASAEASVPLDDPIPFTPDSSLPLINQLGSLTTNHLFKMVDRLNSTPPTFFCTGISVHPSYQSQGVGSALLEWVTSFADQHHASCWIHLSDSPGGVRMLEKNGFREVNRLEVDLDVWVREPRKGGRGWGMYTFRYMRREATG